MFVSHYHGDHIGLYNKILPEIPIYIGEISKNIFKILQERLVYAKIVDKQNLDVIDKFKTYKIKDVTKEAIRYGLESNDIEGMEVLLNKNVDGNYVISVNNNIEVSVSVSYKAILGNIFNKNIYKYEFRYLGIIDDGEIIIREE